MSISKQQVKINNLLDNSYHTDTLHLKTFSNISCNSKRCMGSLMQVDADHLSDTPRTKEELLSHATDFINQYYDDIKRQNTPAHHKRLKEVQHCIERNETYELTFAELSFGAKTAWRNAPRCIGRIQWSKLQVFDARHINTPLEMYLALCNHIKYATNGGNLRSSITVFPQRMKGRQDFRVWNGQFIRYAGYKMDDDTIVGDPASLEFTEQCIKLGWKPKYGRFDVLPLVVSAPGSEPHCFDIPEDIVLEVKIKHPKYPWFADLRLQWFALPGVSKMLFDCGGLEFTACPFNGWYMGTEIGARDFCDANRYNLLEPIADKLELDTTTTASLWKDRVLVEVNIAVLYSYQCAGVTISDHHEASESFIRHIKNEQKLRGGCPGDWVWVVPPMSGCALEVFHQEMLLYKLKPSFEYQDDPWHSLEVSTILPRESKRRSSFKTIARVVMEFSKLLNRAMVKRTRCLILYATETGKSENFARSLAEIFSHAFLVKVVCMEDYDIIELEHESLVLVVASTFGNGEAPENGKEFVKNLQMYRSTASNESKLEDFKSIQKFNYRKSHGTLTFPKPSKRQRPSLFDEPARFSNFRFSVFGLGSKAYPQFAAFGYYVDNLFEALGAERLLPIATGDALCKQEYSFRKWSERIYKSSCKAFCLDLNLSTDARNIGNSFWAPDKFKVTISSNTSKQDLCEILSKFHGKKIVPCTTLDRIQLQSPDSPRQTFLMKLDTHGAMELMYSPGDHIGIFPANSSESVDAILERVAACPNPDKNIELHVMNETVDLKGLSKTWKLYEKMPLCSLRTALTYLLDITTMPSQDFLLAMSFMASNEQDKDRLNQLCTNQKAYEQFKFHQNPTLLDVLNHFPKVKVLPALLLTMLPALQQRYYSISSSPQMFPGQIHVTVAVVAYSLQDGSGSVREGVCSNWLNRCPPKTVVPSFVRSTSTFHLPDQPSVPVIMVGPGTGLAPFRSFWQQRKIDMLMHTKSGALEEKKDFFGDMILYTGCRKSNEDNIYKAELEAMKKDGVLTKYSVAFSREPNSKKVYVQDDLLRDAALVYRIIEEKGGHLYICGDVIMAENVIETLGVIVEQHGRMSEKSALEYCEDLKETNRLHKDIFGVSYAVTRRKSLKFIEEIPSAANTEGSEQSEQEGQPQEVSRRSHQTAPVETISRIESPAAAGTVPILPVILLVTLAIVSFFVLSFFY